MVFLLFSLRHLSRHSLLTDVSWTVKVVVAPDSLNQVLSYLFAPVERPGKVQVTIPDPP